MAELRCPMCAKPNPEELDVCKFCGARLKPLVALSPDDFEPIHPGEQPVKKQTTEFERVIASFGEQGSIQPGDVPTKKNTAELERALPAWLRNLRGQDDGTPPAEPAKPFATESRLPAPETEPAPQPVEVKLPDWLAGFESSSEEDIPEWLADIHAKPQPQPETSAEEKPHAQPEGADWLGRLRQGEAEAQARPTSEAPPFPSEASAAVSLEGLPDWFSDLKSGSAPAQPEAEKKPVPAAAEPASAPSEDFPDWMLKLQEESKAQTHELPRIDVPFEESPDWLEKLQASAFSEPERPVAPIITPETAPEKPAPEAAPFGESPDWLEKLQASAFSELERPSATTLTPEAAAPAEEIPAWLAALNADAVSAQEEKAAAQAFTGAVEPLPDWLTATDFEKVAPLAEVSPPTGAQEPMSIPAEDSRAGFPMEVPDWLSMLGPEEGEQSAAGKPTERAETLEPGELPSWVQAMRPVEAVMAESEVPQENAGEESAAGGPLAGLSGVLPLGPGLGLLRKQPAYSTKLHVTESQQRHAASLERLVSTEGEPRPLRSQSRMPSARILRWVIALVLILAASLPIVTGIHIVPGSVYPTELGPTRELINGMGANSPVLIVFDYEPALSGELEAAAAPVIDHLLFRGPRLAIISTSPTGPLLAEHFLMTTQAAHGYQSGLGYVNLGYLAGGPAGVLGFAENPPVTAAYSFEGAPAWQPPPLQGVQNLSDFAALIILTDNADTGRIWIEQAGPYLKETPMIMVISAQAEPMIRPYYDSQQVKGLVTGLAGGKAYEQANEQAFPGPGLARRYWDAFSVGLFLAVTMILIGGLWSAVAAWHTRRNMPEEGA